MKITLETKYSIGDLVRVMYDRRVEIKFICPFCKGESTYHTGIHKQVLSMSRPRAVEEVVLTCQTCKGKGEITIRTDDIKRVTQKGIYKITGFNNIDARGEAYYTLELVDPEGSNIQYPTTREHDFRLIPVEEGFINKELFSGYTYGKDLMGIVKEEKE